MSVCLNISGMVHMVHPLQKNMQLCFDAPRTFGTTHFIRGYQTKNRIIPENHKKVVVDVIPLKKEVDSAYLIDDKSLIQSFFGSMHNLSSVILKILSQAQKSIRIAAFALTDIDISKQLIDAHQRGVIVSVVMDGSNMKHFSSKAQKLIKNGIDVRRYDPTLVPNYREQKYVPLMHHKYCIVDDKLVITGSANWTKAGLNTNAENINVIRCEKSIGGYCKEFAGVTKYSVKCMPQLTA
jgi:phosphatidylserine/phosphatidylglycerophosphate/cardiolipin synthase-like enzyme